MHSGVGRRLAERGRGLQLAAHIGVDDDFGGDVRVHISARAPRDLAAARFEQPARADDLRRAVHRAQGDAGCWTAYRRVTVMDTATFWEMIDKTREAANGDPRIQSDLLTEELAQLPENDILTFDSIFRDLRDQAYIADLWDAAHVIGCGCSDDGFLEFREWLIGRGKEVFDKALADPESLVDVVEVGEANVFPTLLGVTFKAYERVTGQEMPPMRRERPKLKGEHREEHEALAHFPKLAAKHWRWWLEYFGVKQDEVSKQ